MGAGHVGWAVPAMADARLSQAVQMRYFGVCSEKEIADTLDLTDRTVQRDRGQARIAVRATRKWRRAGVRGGCAGGAGAGVDWLW